MQGSIQKRTGKNGVTWTVVVDLPRDPVTGKRRQKLDGGRLDGKPGGLSARTIRYIHATLHEALSHAMR